MKAPIDTAQRQPAGIDSERSHHEHIERGNPQTNNSRIDGTQLLLWPCDAANLFG
jgi:hypothetical protein